MVKYWACVIGVFCLAAPAPLMAMEAKLSASIGGEHTDNSLQTDSGESSDFENKLGVILGLTHEGADVQTEINYQALRTHYTKDTQADNTEVNGNLDLTYEQVEGAVYWRLDNSIRNIVKDKAASDIAENRENRSNTTLSPEFIMRLSGANQLRMNLSYTDVRYEDSDQDSNRMGGGVQWFRALSEIDNLSLRLNYSDVGFDNDDDGYDYYQAFVNYSANLSKLTYSLSMGYNETQRDGAEDIGGNFLNAEFDYVSGPSSWGLALSQELTDTSRGNGNEGFDELSSFQTTSNEVDVFELTAVRFSWVNSGVCGACVLNTFISFEMEDYKELVDDNEELSADVSFSYDLTRESKISFGVGYSDFSFDDDNSRADYQLLKTRINFTQTVTRDLSVRFFVEKESRDSEDSNIDYDELRGGVSISYDLY